MQISPGEVAERLQAGEQLPLIDVRSREEWETVHIEGATFFTQELMQEIISESAERSGNRLSLPSWCPESGRSFLLCGSRVSTRSDR